MNELIVWILALFTTLLIALFWLQKIRRETKGKHLPGPPLIEGLITFMKGSLNNTLHLYLPKWAEQYGDIMQVNLLVRKAVIVNNADVFKCLTKDPEFRDFTNDRPPTFFLQYINGGDHDIASAPFSPSLISRRRIFHNILKFYGEGKGQFEDLMVTTLTQLKETLRNQDIVDISITFQNYILRLIGFLISGDISADAEKHLDTIQNYSDSGNKMFAFEIDFLLLNFPFLRFVPLFRFKDIYESLCAAQNNLHDSYFYPRKINFDPNQKEGMVDEMISLQQDCSVDTVIDDNIIKGIIQDVVSAAYLTSSSTLSSLFLHLIEHQDIQDKVYDEIKNLIGDELPSFKHRHEMPYTEAVILETLRISSSAPLLVAHFTNKDIIFDGYLIPKSTILLMNAWHNHHREDFWDDPWTFKPERFLDSNGQQLEPDHPTRQKLIAFGTGRRQCPGDTFGKSRIFLTTSFLLQTFQFLPHDSEPLPSLNPQTWAGTAVFGPDHYKCKIKLRCE